uniref:Secreted protein n=1 Tax=Molossus molossus TaxID=27622 RepID=A0A7J8IZJ5_MOLMO|nr:hypothetical protein HJG59_010378 [Molossus molossus]
MYACIYVCVHMLACMCVVCMCTCMRIHMCTHVCVERQMDTSWQGAGCPRCGLMVTWNSAGRVEGLGWHISFSPAAASEMSRRWLTRFPLLFPAQLGAQHRVQGAPWKSSASMGPLSLEIVHRAPLGHEGKLRTCGPSDVFGAQMFRVHSHLGRVLTAVSLRRPTCRPSTAPAWGLQRGPQLEPLLSQLLRCRAKASRQLPGQLQRDLLGEGT